MGAEILLFRIDERLLHGQGQIWIRHCGANSVICVNDKAANDPVQQNLMKAMIDKSIAVSFYGVDKFISIFDKASPRQRFFIVVGNTQDAIKIIKSGIPIKEVNIGNIHDGEGKERITRAIYLNESDKDNLRKMRDDYNISFNTRSTPSGSDGSKEVDINDYL